MDAFDYGLLKWRSEAGTFSAELVTEAGTRPLQVEGEFAALNLLGADGWEAVSRTTNPLLGRTANNAGTVGKVFFKRRLG